MLKTREKRLESSLLKPTQFSAMLLLVLDDVLNDVIEENVLLPIYWINSSLAISSVGTPPSSPWQKSEFYKTHGISAKR
jgi:hypothetical protein